MLNKRMQRGIGQIRKWSILVMGKIISAIFRGTA